MREEKFLEVFGNIDDRFVEESNVATKVHAKRNWTRLAGIAAGLLVVFGIVAIAYNISNKPDVIVTPTTTFTEQTIATAPPQYLPPTDASPTEVSPTEVTDGNSECGGLGEIDVDNICIHLDGVDYWVTDEVGYEFLNENYESIKSSLIESGVSADNLKITDHGYSHFRTEDNTIAVNYRDYLAYNDGELVSIITVINDEGGLWYSPAFCGPWFKQYGDFLDNHSGEKLVYLYVGIAEIVVTPDNNLYYTISGEPYENIIEGVDYYTLLNQESNTYIP